MTGVCNRNPSICTWQMCHGGPPGWLAVATASRAHRVCECGSTDSQRYTFIWEPRESRAASVACRARYAHQQRWSGGCNRAPCTLGIGESRESRARRGRSRKRGAHRVRSRGVGPRSIAERPVGALPRPLRGPEQSAPLATHPRTGRALLPLPVASLPTRPPFRCYPSWRTTSPSATRCWWRSNRMPYTWPS